ncbi:hypothetical protein ARMSODRAFT_980734 [Armillaria solidipes]|uniref:Uncharacterized protein n=1 Tax=Armillaria solidipes TaxID=1076256 RepID=A0A2H3B8U3_9AGAR|nr:hypothetical protein ARMSODRAFT_980734 [Armillaria solidipes]
MSEKKTKAASGLVICNYNGHKVTNTYLSTSNMSSPRDTEDWEVPASEIREWTYTLIDLFGYENVLYFRDKAMESPLNERAVMLLACEGEVLRNHTAVCDRVTAWRNNVTVVPSHAPPIHPFDSHRRVFSFLNDEPYNPGEAPDDAPTLDAGDYERWLLLTVLGKPRHDDRKASEGRNILWRLVHHDPRTEPYDWEDFRHSKRDDRTRHHRASRDERTNAIYDNTASDTLVRSIRDRWACSDSRLNNTNTNTNNHEQHNLQSSSSLFHRRQQRASSVTLVEVVLGMVRITSGEAPWSWWKEEKNNMDAVYNVKEREKIRFLLLTITDTCRIEHCAESVMTTEAPKALARNQARYMWISLRYNDTSPGVCYLPGLGICAWNPLQCVLHSRAKNNEAETIVEATSRYTSGT